MKKITKMDTIDELIKQLNKIRESNTKSVVVRRWTGAGHWLKTVEDKYKSIGGIFTSDDEFIGFLRGLIFRE